MNKTLQYAILLCLTIISLSSCVNRNADNYVEPVAVTPIEAQRIADCHYNNNPYPTQITALLEGQWLWTKQRDPYTGLTYLSDKQVIIKFNDANVFSVMENTVIVAQGTWTITSIGSDSWRLETSTPSEYLLGDIFICGDELLLSDIARDGFDNLYEKRN